MSQIFPYNATEKATPFSYDPPLIYSGNHNFCMTILNKHFFNLVASGGLYLSMIDLYKAAEASTFMLV